MTTVFPNSGNLQPGATESSRRLELDNLIRRELKVGDPNDARQVAEALMERYQSDARARAISQESKGLPFLHSLSSAPATREAITATKLDMEQAVNDVNMDLRELTTNNLLKDVVPELQGWSDAIRNGIQEAESAARFSLDPRQRDKTFAIRRQLGDYARMARLVGALTPAANSSYRNLAQSLDEVSSVLLVMMGEAMANVGFAGGRYLLQTPHTELQVRRDSVIYALRNLVGSTQQAYGPNEWSRGVNAYRQLFDELEKHGQGDLRSLLVENELARIMDELIRRAAQGTSDGLRALGSTVQIDLQRFSRLIAISNNAVKPKSPPLSSLLEALQLFVDAFKPAGGFRLLRIARPPILFYGLYGNNGEEKADQRLLQLLIRRGMLASQLDCLMRCDCAEETVRCQIALDKVLYDVDRAIDLYAVGNVDLGEPEQRAAGYSYMIDAVLVLGVKEGQVQQQSLLGECGTKEPIKATIMSIQALLRPIALSNEKSFWDSSADKFDAGIDNVTEGKPTSDLYKLMHRELCSQYQVENNWQQLIATMAPNCISSRNIFGEDGVLRKLTRTAINKMLGLESDELNNPVTCPSFLPTIPFNFEDAFTSDEDN